MAAPLFDPDKCDIDAIPSLGFEFVSECAIPETPPPIFDCPIPLIPRDPPPAICPEFGGAARVNYYNQNCPEQSEPNAFAITRLDSDPCRFFIDLDLSIPLPEIPCPDIAGGSVRVTTGYADCVGEARGEITVAANPVETNPCDGSDGSQAATACRFTIDLDLTVPIPRPVCPVIEAGAVTVTTGYADCVGAARGSLRVTAEEPVDDCSDGDSAQCQFTIDLDLTVPIPRPVCPVIDGGVVTVNTGYADFVGAAGGTLTIQTVATEADCSDSVGSQGCQYVIDLDIDIPIPTPVCPDINATGTIDYIDGTTPTINAEFVATETPGDIDQPPTCQFDLNIDIGLPTPRPCPEITGDVSVYFADSPTGSFAVTPTETASGVCKFDLNIDIGIPNIRPCPEITGDVNVYYSTGPTGYMAVTPTESASGVCTFDLDINVGLPPIRPCPEITGDVDVYYADTPTGYLVVTPTENASGVCTFDLTINVGIPQVRACPVITGDVDVYYADTPTGYLVVTPTENASGVCTFDLDINVGVPPVRPCPQFNGYVTVYETSSPTGTVVFTPYAPATATDPCAYEVAINVGYRQAKVERGSVTCAWTTCGVSPSCDLTIHPPNTAGVQLLDLDIRIPYPPNYTGGTLVLKDAANNTYGTGYISVGSTGCTREVSGVVTLNTTACESTAGGGGGGLAPGDPGYVGGGG
jgi:hypothetical protein